MLYNPQGEVLKHGHNSVGHILLPQLPDDSGDDEQGGGGGLSSWMIVALALGGFALLLTVATKYLGPNRRR